MKIAIVSDHAGCEEKERLKPLLDELGTRYEDLGTISEASVDYPANSNISLLLRSPGSYVVKD